MSLQVKRHQQLGLESYSKLVGRIALLETTLRRLLTDDLVLSVLGAEEVKLIVRNIEVQRGAGLIELDDQEFLRGVNAESADLLSQLEVKGGARGAS